MPPTKPWSPGSVAGAPRDSPYGFWYCRVTCWPCAVMEIETLFCRSPSCQLSPSCVVRTARALSLKL